MNANKKWQKLWVIIQQACELANDDPKMEDEDNYAVMFRILNHYIKDRCILEDVDLFENIKDK